MALTRDGILSHRNYAERLVLSHEESEPVHVSRETKKTLHAPSSEVREKI